MNLFIKSFVFLMIFSLAKADYFFIGNAGEGYLIDKGLFTRDLYDYDLHLQPWIGTNADPLLKKAVNKWNPLELSEHECDLLAQKLTDLNQAKKYLGDDFLLILQFFSWTWTNENLVLLQPDEIRRSIDESKRVSIANRYLQSIVINKASFQKLNSENKIALILHEVVFSLITTEFNPQGIQSLSMARQIVAGLFNKQVLFSSGFLAMVNYLNIESPGAFDTTSTRALKENFIYVQFNERPMDFSRVLQKVSLKSLSRRSSKLANNLCTDYFRKNNVLGSMRLIFNSIRQAKMVPYMPQAGGGYQSAMGIVNGSDKPPVEISLSRLLQPQDVQTCAEELRRALLQVAR